MDKYYRQGLFMDMSDEDIDEMLDRYYYTDQKIPDLMADYHISVHPSLLAANFPYILQEEKKCEYCNVPMYARFASKSLLKEKGYWDKERQVFTGEIKPYERLICTKCGHEEYLISTSNIKSCTCYGCLSKLKEEDRKKAIKQKEARLERIRKREEERIEKEKLEAEKRELEPVKREKLQEKYGSLPARIKDTEANSIDIYKLLQASSPDWASALARCRNNPGFSMTSVSGIFSSPSRMKKSSGKSGMATL